MKQIKTTMGELPTQIDWIETDDWYFTIGRGKAKYHMWSIAENTCGLHYCYRLADNGILEAKRAVEPNKEVILHYA